MQWKREQIEAISLFLSFFFSKFLVASVSRLCRQQDYFWRFPRNLREREREKQIRVNRIIWLRKSLLYTENSEYTTIWNITYVFFYANCVVAKTNDVVNYVISYKFFDTIKTDRFYRDLAYRERLKTHVDFELRGNMENVHV